MGRTKILLLGDSPSGHTGLGRIWRDVALRIHENLSDVFEVATLGYGAQSSSRLPFKQYEMKVENLIPTNLPESWRDFAGDERGVCLVCWNLSWVPWLADPENFAKGELRDFLLTQPFSRWAYLPIDGDCRPGRLPLNMAETLCGFDRVAHYTHWAKGITDAAIFDLTSGRKVESAVLPHGLDTNIFYPRDKKLARETLVQRMVGGFPNPIKDDVFLCGVCATNSPRKDYGLAFETCAELLRRGVNVSLLIHCDHPRKSWDLVGLTREFGLAGRVLINSNPLDDETMALFYSALDVNLAIGSGGGWELPITEALGCGIPTVHVDYAGGAELLPPEGRVEPIGYRHDGFFAVRRPVQSAVAWADAVQRVAGTKMALPPYVPWDEGWKLWSKWLTEGLSQ